MASWEQVLRTKDNFWHSPRSQAINPFPFTPHTHRQDTHHTLIPAVVELIKLQCRGSGSAAHRSHSVHPCMYFRNRGWSLCLHCHCPFTLSLVSLSKWDLRNISCHFRFLHQESCGRKHPTTALGWRLEASFIYSILAGSRELSLQSVDKDRTLCAHALRKCTESLIFKKNN